MTYLKFRENTDTSYDKEEARTESGMWIWEAEVARGEGAREKKKQPKKQSRKGARLERIDREGPKTKGGGGGGHEASSEE